MNLSRPWKKKYSKPSVPSEKIVKAQQKNSIKPDEQSSILIQSESDVILKNKQKYLKWKSEHFLQKKQIWKQSGSSGSGFPKSTYFLFDLWWWFFWFWTIVETHWNKNKVQVITKWSPAEKKFQAKQCRITN